MSDTVSPSGTDSDAEFSRARRAVERGWITQEQLEAAILAHETDSRTPLLSHLPLQPEQVRQLDALEATAPTILAGRTQRTGLTPPSDVAEALRNPERRVDRYSGALRLVRGDKEGAQAQFRRCVETDVIRFVEYWSAAAELKSLEEKK